MEKATRGAVACLALAVAVALASCTIPGGAQTPTPTPPTVATPTAPAASATLMGQKKAAKVSLPRTLADWTIARTLASPEGQSVRFYLKPGDDPQDLRAILSTVPLTQGSLDAVLTGQQRVGSATCGTLIAVRQVGPPTRERPIYFCPRCQGVAS